MSKEANGSSEAGKDEVAMAIPPLPQNWDRCHAYNQLKRRYCRQIPIPVSGDSVTKNHPRYCGNHAQLYEEMLSARGQKFDRDEVDDDDDNENSRKMPRICTHATHSNSGPNKKVRGKRIPRPIDPSHLIFEGSISKHVLVCPAAKRRQEVAGKEYYCEGVNLGGFGGMGNAHQNPIVDSGDAKELAYSVLSIFSHLFLTRNKLHNGTLNNKANNCNIQQLQTITESEIYHALPEMDLSGVEELGLGYSSCDATPGISSGDEPSSESVTNQVDENGTKSTGRLSRAISQHRIRAGGPHHLRQIASILGHVRHKNLLKRDDREGGSLVVEMGAGRGMTGLIVAGAMGASKGKDNAKVQLCLVERSGTRGKAETRVRMSEGKNSEDDCLRLDLVDVTRVKCDLAHVDMTKALGSHQSPVGSSTTVVIAKHLCGVGTDLALKSIRNLGRIDGCVFATCCHSLCNWNDYVGRNCLLRLFCSEPGGITTFGEKQFNLMKRWASASILEDRTHSPNAETKEDHKNVLDDDDKGRCSNIFAVVGALGLKCGGNGLGRACQRLIDYGRCDYMRKNLLTSESGHSSSGEAFNVQLLHYVPRDVTPQNALIIATRA